MNIEKNIVYECRKPQINLIYVLQVSHIDFIQHNMNNLCVTECK